MHIPRLIAHRGYSAKAPENTLASIRAAANAGIAWIELDVQCLADGTPVLWHDAHMARCSNSRALLAQLNIQEAKQIDVGSWFDSAFSQERIATLDEALDLVCQLGLGLNLELKLSTARDPKRLAERVVPLLKNRLSENQLLVSSFSQDALYRAHQLDPDLPLGILYDDKIPRIWRWDAERINAVSVNANWEHLGRLQAHDIKESGLLLVCYTINDPQAFDPFWNFGIDSAISDDPLLFDQFEKDRDHYAAQTAELRARCPLNQKRKNAFG